MADALISFLIEQLASTAFEQMKENVRLVLDVEKEVDQFTQSLKTIQAVLKDAENRRVEEAVVQDWLDKLKGVSYEMDNVLDEWNTQALKQQIKKQENEGENALVNKKKVCFSIPSPSNCFCFGQGRPIVVCHAIAKDIKDLNSRLTKIAEDRHNYQFQYTTISGIEQLQQPKTFSLVDVSGIFGRENEKHTLISMLLGQSTCTSEEERGPLVIPLVGMGGMGKTTLAQLAYNDENVKAHFNVRKWVCVSDPFDEIKIAKAIINETQIPDELDALMEKVSKFVEDKRFLLVLDDVWTENDTKWKQLKLALMSGAQGSRILVTTRKVIVARMMGATKHMIHLEKLSDQICSSLFYHFAVLDGEKDKSCLFEAVGNDIVKKCDGLPLAAKTLGSLMCYKNTLQEWRDVLNNEMWKIKKVEQNVFRPLLLSYYDLASEIKRCLLFCASFPKDYVIFKDNLIEFWMSQNYLNLKRRKEEKRAIGQEYFDDLVMRSFFQDIQMDKYGKIRSCKMHDMVHDFVQFLTRNECFIIEANQAIEKLSSSDSVHHLTLMLAADRPLSLPAPFHTCKKLRSLATFNNRLVTIRRIDWDLILQLKCLRALNLSNCNVEKVPKEIGELLHLRYIDLSKNRYLKELPDAMCNLCNLETLHLENCLGLEKLPKAMGKLINLKHLYLDRCSRLSGLPKGVGRLRGLRILDRFVCGGGDDKEILELGDLGSFDHLQGTLWISKLGNVKDAREQAQKAPLEKKKHLLELGLDFGHNSGEQQRISDEEVLNALRPHPDLKSLKVWYYECTTLVFGNWIMSLQHLTHLTLFGFEYCESLPPLGKLPYLEVLDIHWMPRVKKVGVELLGIEETQTSPATATPTAIAFPKLKQLYFFEMKNWEEWEGVGDDCQVTIMPCLSFLSIEGAPELIQLPDFLLHNRPQLQFEGYKAEYLARRGKAVVEYWARRGKAVSSIG